jgi:hypothetical protein
MIKRTRQSEGKLDSFREQLLEYESLILKKHDAEQGLVDLDKRITALRQQMIGNKALLLLPNGKGDGRRAPSMSPTTEEVLAGCDPRVRKSLGAALRVLQKLGGTGHVDQVATRLKISSKAAMLRLARGVKIGLVKRVEKGTYAAT